MNKYNEVLLRTYTCPF